MDQTQTAVATAEKQAVNLDTGEVMLPTIFKSEASLMMDPNVFEHMQRVCKVYSASDVVPTQFRGNLANCMIAFELAHRMKANVFMLMQSMYVVQGKPGLEAKLVIALVNMRGPFRGPIQYDFKRDDKGKALACTAYATHKATGQRCEATVTWEIVEKEGWSKKNGSKWLTMPDQMFMYRSAAWLARAYCPEVIMGMHTADELEDTYQGVRYIDNEVRSTPARVAARLGAATVGQSDGATSDETDEEIAARLDAARRKGATTDDTPRSVDEADGESQLAAEQTDDPAQGNHDSDAGGEPAGDANAEAPASEQAQGPTPYERCVMAHSEKHGIIAAKSITALGKLITPDMTAEEADKVLAKIEAGWAAPKK